MNKQQLIDYIMHTPKATNPHIIQEQLEELVAASASTSTAGGNAYVFTLTEEKYNYDYQENIYILTEEATAELNPIVSDSNINIILARSSPMAE